MSIVKNALDARSCFAPGIQFGYCLHILEVLLPSSQDPRTVDVERPDIQCWVAPCACAALLLLAGAAPVVISMASRAASPELGGPVASNSQAAAAQVATATISQAPAPTFSTGAAGSTRCQARSGCCMKPSEDSGSHTATSSAARDTPPSAILNRTASLQEHKEATRPSSHWLLLCSALNSAVTWPL